MPKEPTIVHYSPAIAPTGSLIPHSTSLSSLQDTPKSTMATKSTSNQEYAVFGDKTTATPMYHYQGEAAHGANVTVDPYSTPMAAPHKHNWAMLTLKLVLFNILNFVYATIAFMIVVTIGSLSVSLLPLLGLGAFVYIWSLPVVGWLAHMDVALANMITPVNLRVSLNKETLPSGLELASDLSRFSWRSTFAVIYFWTAKFVVGLLSLVAVCLPFLPIASHIVHAKTHHNSDNWIAGFEVDSFNFDTDPVWFTLAWIGYTIVGLVLIHVVGRMSRALTRYVCCRESTTATLILTPMATEA